MSLGFFLMFHPVYRVYLSVPFGAFSNGNKKEEIDGGYSSSVNFFFFFESG